MNLRRRRYLTEEKATGKVLPKFLPKTEVSDPSGLRFSFWDGKVALVTTSWLDESDPRNWFDPQLVARKHLVRYALDPNSLKPFKAEKIFLRAEPAVSNPSIPYEKTSFSIYGGRGLGSVIKGRFGPSVEVWVKLKWGQLGKGELSILERYWLTLGYYDSGYHKLTGADWKKAFSMRSYRDVQDKFGYEKANMFEEVLKRLNGHRYPDENQEEGLWKSIKGVFALTRKNDKVRYFIKR